MIGYQNMQEWGIKERYNMKWHMECNDIENATWTCTYMREPQKNSHKRPMDENEVSRNACTWARIPRQWYMQCKCGKNGMQACLWIFSNEIWGKTVPK